MAKFKKGESGNPKGRGKGAKNRTTSEIQTALLQLLDDNLEALQTDFNNIKGKDRASLIISLAKHCTPAALQPQNLTEDQLLQIVEYLKQQQNGNKEKA